MAVFSVGKTDSALEKVEIVRTEMKRKFVGLHVALDERESDLNHELNQIKSNLSCALAQWEKRIEDVQHTLAHANNEIRDNRWSSRLEKEAKEELEILKNSKPKFSVKFSIYDGFVERIETLGEIYVEQIKETRKILTRAISVPSEAKLPRTKPERNKLQLSDSYIAENDETKYDQLLRGDPSIKYRRDLTVRFDSRAEVNPYSPIERAHTFPQKSISLLDIRIEKCRIEKQSCPVRAFDDSCIVKGDIIYRCDFGKRIPPKDKIAAKPKKTRTGTRKDLEKKKMNFSLRKRAKTNVSLATYKLSELKIKKYLTHDVTVVSRWDKTKDVKGILRCIVPGDEKIPIVGIELETNDGNSEGKYLGVQYFSTERFKSYFLSADKVLIQV